MVTTKPRRTNPIRALAVGDYVKFMRYRGEVIEGTVEALDPRRAWADITVEGDDTPARMHVYETLISSRRAA